MNVELPTVSVVQRASMPIKPLERRSPGVNIASLGNSTIKLAKVRMMHVKIVVLANTPLHIHKGLHRIVKIVPRVNTAMHCTLLVANLVVQVNTMIRIRALRNPCASNVDQANTIMKMLELWIVSVVDRGNSTTSLPALQKIIVRCVV